MTPTELRQAFKARIATLLEELRASDRAFWGRYDSNGCSIYRSGYHPREAGYLEVTGPIVAAKVEAEADALVEATAVDLELLLAELVPAEFHAVTLADADLIKWFPWSEQTKAGQWVLLWGGGWDVPSRPWPEGVTYEEVATWMLPALKRRNHPLANDPAPWTPEEWGADEAEISRRIKEEGMEWEEIEALRNAQTKRTVEWEGRAEHSLLTVARGFTYPHNGNKSPPGMLVPMLEHPVTGGRWVWGRAMATLYLANPVTVAARCVHALERVTKDRRALSDAARAALGGVKGEHTEEMVGKLADALLPLLLEIRGKLDVDAAMQSLRDRTMSETLPWDKTAVDFYAERGTHGKKAAKVVQSAAVKRWADATSGAGRLFSLWTPLPPHGVPLFVVNLAAALWADVVGPWVEAQRNKHTPAERELMALRVELMKDGLTRVPESLLLPHLVTLPDLTDKGIIQLQSDGPLTLRLKNGAAQLDIDDASQGLFAERAAAERAEIAQRLVTLIQHGTHSTYAVDFFMASLLEILHALDSGKLVGHHELTPIRSKDMLDRMGWARRDRQTDAVRYDIHDFFTFIKRTLIRFDKWNNRKLDSVTTTIYQVGDVHGSTPRAKGADPRRMFEATTIGLGETMSLALFGRTLAGVKSTPTYSLADVNAIMHTPFDPEGKGGAMLVPRRQYQLLKLAIDIRTRDALNGKNKTDGVILVTDEELQKEVGFIPGGKTPEARRKARQRMPKQVQDIADAMAKAKAIDAGPIYTPGIGLEVRPSQRMVDAYAKLTDATAKAASARKAARQPAKPGAKGKRQG